MSHIKPLAERLMELKLKVAVAESCTGGLLAQQCTSLSGSSHWFECGFVTYSNASKIRLLEVEADILNEHGAVSAQVAEQMAIGVLMHSDAELSASITGIAGPDGGTDAKPVGTVYIATAMRNEVKNQPAHVHVTHHLFQGDRQSIREQTADEAVVQLIRQLHD